MRFIRWGFERKKSYQGAGGFDGFTGVSVLGRKFIGLTISSGYVLRSLQKPLVSVRYLSVFIYLFFYNFEISISGRDD